MNSSKNRLHGLDFARAILMILGIFFHTGMIYATQQDWRVTSNDTSDIITLACNFLHSFRMEAFYLISGFFFALLHDKNRPKFVLDRVIRILPPLVFVGLTINSAMNYISYNFEFNQGIDYIIKGDWLGHLWFLGNLIIYFMISSPACKLISQNSKKTLKKIIILCVTCLLIAILLRSNFGNIINKRFVFITLSPLFYFYAYFIVGIALKNSNKYLFKILSIKCAPLYFFTYLLMNYYSGNISFTQNEREVSEFLELLSRFPLVLCVISVLNHIGNIESKRIRTLSNASYTIYLLHEPLIVFQYVLFFQQAQLNIYIEYSLMVAITLATSFAAHQYIVSRFNITKFLFNGIPFRTVKVNSVHSNYAS